VDQLAELGIQVHSGFGCHRELRPRGPMRWTIRQKHIYRSA
jgi:hypothetical protein